jgi:hypothetical protein
VGVLVAAVAAGHAVQSRQDANLWDRGADEQEKVLAAVRHAASGVQARPLTVYSFGAPASISESIPVFSTTYDLDGAARATLDDPSLHAYPVWGDVRLTCGASRVVPAGRRHFDASISAPYGRAVLVDVPTGRTARPIDRAACLRALEGFVPGERLASD